MVESNSFVTRADDCRSLSETIPIAIAEAAGVDPMDLHPPLYEVVDLDALDALFTGSGTGNVSDLQVTFEYARFEVVVSGPDDVEVTSKKVEQPSVAVASQVEP